MRLEGFKKKDLCGVCRYGKWNFKPKTSPICIPFWPSKVRLNFSPIKGNHMQIWRYIFYFAYHTSLLKSHIFISILSHNSDMFFLSYFFSLSLRWAVLHYYLFIMLSNLLRFIFTSSFICAHTIYSSCLSNFIPGQAKPYMYIRECQKFGIKVYWRLQFLEYLRTLTHRIWQIQTLSPRSKWNMGEILAFLA